jgi:hypothetical protein
VKNGESGRKDDKYSENSNEIRDKGQIRSRGSVE